MYSQHMYHPRRVRGGHPIAPVRVRGDESRYDEGYSLGSPPFGENPAAVYRRAPLGFETASGAAFFSVPAGAGQTATVTAKVSRPFHCDRLLIIPSAPGLVISSISVGDRQQLAAPNAPVELYGTQALTDTRPDNFEPVPTGVTFSITLMNTTGEAITGTIGAKGGVER